MTARPINNLRDLGAEVLHLLNYERRKEIAERQPGGVSPDECKVLLQTAPTPEDLGSVLTIWWLDYTKLAHNYASCIETNGKILKLLSDVVDHRFEEDESYDAEEAAEAAVEEIENLRSEVREKWKGAPKTQAEGSLKARLQAWRMELRECRNQPLVAALLDELTDRFPELLGTNVEITDATQKLHPMQQVVWGEDKVIRFRKNQIVRDMVDQLRAAGAPVLNNIAGLDYTPEDRMQFDQLLGTSVSAYGESDYVSEESLGAADKAAEELLTTKLPEGPK